MRLTDLLRASVRWRAMRDVLIVQIEHPSVRRNHMCRSGREQDDRKLGIVLVLCPGNISTDSSTEEVTDQFLAASICASS